MYNVWQCGFLGLVLPILVFAMPLIGQGQDLSGVPVFVIEESKTIKINHEKIIRVTGHIHVPENRFSANPKNIRLPVIIYKSTNANPFAPVFRLAGGPGESNIPTSVSNTGLLKNHDFVFVGYRGVDGPSVLKSKKLARALKGKDKQLLSDASLDHVEQAAKEYLEELKNEGVDIRGYTIMEVIEDLEHVRKALGYNTINLLSGSYGTRVALLYSYKYPEVLHRTIMNGANPPGHFVWYPEKTEEILNKWDSIFIANNQGPIKKTMKTALDNMPKKWSVFTLDKDKIKTGTFVFLFSTNMAVMAFDAYSRAAYHKDYSGLYMLQKAYDLFVPRNTWGDMFQKGFSADFDPAMNYRDYLRPFDETTVLGANYALLLWGSAGSWQSGTIPDEYRKLRQSQTETLILSGELDVSTPAAFATEKLMPFMPNASQLILQNMSHTDVAGAQPVGYRAVINEFFLSGSINRQAYQAQAIDFKPRYRLHRLAKWGFPILVFF